MESDTIRKSSSNPFAAPLDCTDPDYRKSSLIRDFSIPLRVRHATIFSQRSVVARASLFLATSRDALYAFNFHSLVG